MEKKSKMATEQDPIKQAIAQAAVETARVGVQLKAAGRTDNNDRIHNTVPNIDEPKIQRPTFNWET